MKLRVKRGFYDKEAERYRPTGEVFDVAEARASEILAAGVAEVVEASAGSLPEEPETESAPAEADSEKPKRRTKKE